jgi:hypothetical protein
VGLRTTWTTLSGNGIVLANVDVLDKGSELTPDGECDNPSSEVELAFLIGDVDIVAEPGEYRAVGFFKFCFGEG